MTHTTSRVDQADDLAMDLPERSAPGAARKPGCETDSAQQFQIPQPVADLLGPFAGPMEEAFRRMSLAEDAIERFSARHRQQATLLYKAFGILKWRLPVRVRDQVFIAHIEELLQRVVDGQCVADGTRAEALACLNSASLKAPLPQKAAALYAQLFRELLNIEALFEEDKKPTEPWPGASAELLETLRRDLCVADRIYPKTGDAQ